MQSKTREMPDSQMRDSKRARFFLAGSKLPKAIPAFRWMGYFVTRKDKMKDVKWRRYRAPWKEN